MKQLALGVTALAALALARTALADDPVPQTSFTGIHVTGQSDSGPFEGTLDIERFVAIGGQVVAVGRLSGAAGGNSYDRLAVAVPVVTQHGKGSPPGAGRGERGASLQAPRGALVVPAAWDPAVLHGAGSALARSNPMIVQAQAACDVLHLALGPVDLDLLGLVVHLEPVLLDITAQPGGGNLLGNLLCAVTGLLNGFNPNLAGQLASLLNSIAAILAAP